MIETRPLAPFGARIEGVEIDHAAPPDLTAIVRTVATQGVVVLPGQERLNDDTFAAFLSRIGAPMTTAGEPALDGHPTLNRVSNVGRDRPPRSVFHSDTSYVATPPAFTALRAVMVPEDGGETVFASGYDAWDRLDAERRATLLGALVLHRATGVEDATETWHPLVRQHPMTERPALFMSTHERCVDLRLADGTARPDLIPEIFAHYTDRGRLLRHRWRPGDVVIWDNRCTLHRADHSSVKGDRVLHRGMVAGEAPLPAAA
jgi:taurine dioxygenase